MEGNGGPPPKYFGQEQPPGQRVSIDSSRRPSCDCGPRHVQSREWRLGTDLSASWNVELTTLTTTRPTRDGQAESARARNEHSVILYNHVNKTAAVEIGM